MSLLALDSLDLPCGKVALFAFLAVVCSYAVYLNLSASNTNVKAAEKATARGGLHVVDTPNAVTPLVGKTSGKYSTFKKVEGLDGI